MTLLILGSGFLFGSSTSTGASTATPLPFLAPFFGSGGAVAAGVPRLPLFSFDLESPLSAVCVGSSGVPSPAWSGSTSAESSGFGSSSSSSLSS